MPSISSIKGSNDKITGSNIPSVAVFIGATAGIGKATLTSLVSKKLDLKVYIIGRNKQQHEPFLDQLRNINPKATIIWLEGQVSLLAEETSEGLDASLVLQYWSRALFITSLLPLLRYKPSDKTEYTPRVISIMAAGDESLKHLPLNDLDLKQPENFGIAKVAHVYPSLNTLFMARVAEQQENHDVVFIHYHPGIVRTDIILKEWGSKRLIPGLIRTIRPLMALVGTVSVDTSAERCMYLITSADYGGNGVRPNSATQGSTVKRTRNGALFCVDDKCSCLQPDKFLRDARGAGADEIVWRKTREVIGAFV
ncbi:hypothetical protein BX600DRAFT_438873 [Xylariales sp. PMI_506]|nr:hypothetical protein BX600DRAFT_438873 [Xylariales sp. PMI_506]